jgi:methylase of polypeptide subunit release factors
MLSTDKAKAAIIKAKEEIAEENLKKAVDLLKKKLREREAAQTVLSNIDREICELELKIEQGNI